MKSLYENILKSTKEIKTKIMTQLAEDFILPMGGIPQEVSEELETLAAIDGLVISALSERGVQLNNENTQGYVNICLNGVTYRTHRSKFPMKGRIAAAEIQSFPTASLEEKTNVVAVSPISTQEPPIIVNTSDNIEEVFVSQEEEEVVIEENTPSESEVDVEIVTEEASFIEDEETVIVMEETDGESYGEFVVEAEEDDEQEEELVKATVIGGPAVLPPVNAITGDIFIEEKTKHSEQFVFDLHRITVCHVGSRAEDMEIMIAPLKIQKYACPSVPIIVSVYYKGKMYFASSYDNNAEGRNTVQMEVNEYYLLFRGFFNDRGEFQSTINTTAISSNQGDILTQVGLKKHRPVGPEVKNGHIKFRYQGEEGPGILEVFPIDLYGDDFAIMSRSGEFTDYYAMSKRKYGLQRIILYDDGVKSEVVCNWNGEYLEADIVPL